VHGSEVSSRLLRLSSLIHANNVEAKLRRLSFAVKASFNPNQPRVPAGNSDAGQWTDAGGGDASNRVTPATGGGATDTGRPRAIRTDGERFRDFGSARRISTDLEEQCWAQHMRDIFQCRMVGLRSCYQQAALRYGNCLVGLPIPPLNY
jgi:hypothetical protein